MRRSLSPMPKAAEVTSAAFPVLLRGLKELSDAFPAPAGSIIKGIVQTTLYIMELAQVDIERRQSRTGSDLDSHQKYQQSKEDAYLLALRAAEVVAIVANNCDPAKITPEFKNNLDGLRRWEIARASQAIMGSD